MWSNLQLDHANCIFVFNVSDKDKTKDIFNWRNTQLRLKGCNCRKQTSILFFLFFVYRFLEKTSFCTYYSCLLRKSVVKKTSIELSSIKFVPKRRNLSIQMINY